MSRTYVRCELLRTVRNRRYVVFALGFPIVLYFLIAGPNKNEDNLAGSGLSAPLYYMVGLASFGGMGGVSFLAQLVGSVLGAAYAVVAGILIYTVVDVLFGLRLGAEDEKRGADLSIHKIGANPEEDVRLGRT